MSFLDDLLEHTRDRVAEARAVLTDDVLEQRLAAAPAPRGFAAALAGPGTSIVAEIKRATPSKGTLRADLDPRKLAHAYREGGAAAISVLTEPDRFKGSLEDLRAASEAGLPVLRKDFVVDPLQVFEARAEGADAVLLIVRILQDDLAGLMAAARSVGLDALVEVYDDSDMKRAADAGAELIGVNRRDLETFEVDPDRMAKLAPSRPEGSTLVALSGVSGREDVERLAAAGADAVLVGEALVTADDPAAKLRGLLDGG